MSNQENQDRKLEESKSSTKDFMLGAIIGGIVGAATALFLSQKSNEEIRSTFNGLKDNAISKGNELFEVVKDISASFTTTPIIQPKETVNKDIDFREKEEHTTHIKYVPIEPYKPSHEELQKKLQEAKDAFVEEEQRVKG